MEGPFGDYMEGIILSKNPSFKRKMNVFRVSLLLRCYRRDIYLAQRVVKRFFEIFFKKFKKNTVSWENTIYSNSEAKAHYILQLLFLSTGSEKLLDIRLLEN